MGDEDGVPLWKVVLISGVFTAISTIGLYYVEHPEKLSQTKKYLLRKVGYDVDNVREKLSNGISKEELREMINKQVYEKMKEYLPSI